MKLRQRNLIAVPLLVVVLMAAACTPTTATVTKVQQIVLDSTIALQGLQNAEISLHHGGLVSTDEHHAIQAGISKAATALTVANDAVLKAKDATTAKAAAAVAVAALSDLVTSLNVIKNPTAKASLQASITALQAVLALIGAA